MRVDANLKPTHREVVVYVLPDLATCLPSKATWEASYLALRKELLQAEVKERERKEREKKENEEKEEKEAKEGSSGETKEIAEEKKDKDDKKEDKKEDKKDVATATAVEGPPAAAKGTPTEAGAAPSTTEVGNENGGKKGEGEKEEKEEEKEEESLVPPPGFIFRGKRTANSKVPKAPLTVGHTQHCSIEFMLYWSML